MSKYIYPWNQDDNLVYMINIDDKAYGLTSKANYLSIDVFRNFVGEELSTFLV